MSSPESEPCPDRSLREILDSRFKSGGSAVTYAGERAEQITLLIKTGLVEVTRYRYDPEELEGMPDDMRELAEAVHIKFPFRRYDTRELRVAPDGTMKGTYFSPLPDPDELNRLKHEIDTAPFG